MKEKGVFELLNRGTKAVVFLVMVLGATVLSSCGVLGNTESNEPSQPEPWILILEDFETGEIKNVAYASTAGEKMVLVDTTREPGNAFALKLPYNFVKGDSTTWRSVYIQIRRDRKNIDLSKADVLEFWINNDGGAVTDGKVQVILQCFDLDMTNQKNYNSPRIQLTSGWQKITVNMSEFTANGVSIPEAELKRVTRVQFVLGPAAEGAGHTLFDDIVFREL